MAQYLETYQQFITEVFDYGWFAAEIDRVKDMIDPYVQQDPTAFCTYEEFQTGSQTLKAFCLKRAQSVTNQLNGDNTQVNASELDLSVMGTMNNGGGFGGPGGDNQQDRNAPTDGSTDPAQQDAQAATADDFGSSGGQSSAQPASTPAAEAEDQETAAEAPAAEDEGQDEAAESTAPERERSAGFSQSNLRRNSNADAWIWIAISAGLLAAAFIITAAYRNNR